MIAIGSRGVGDGAPCFVAAEVGINHNGDVKLAHSMIDAAADAGADAVKFQNYRTDDFLSDRTIMYEYISQGRQVVESQYDLFKRCELPSGLLTDLRKHCERRGVIFFSTPTDEEGVRDLVRAGAAALKNGSDYLGNLRLISAMARTSLPTVISTGMATVDEIEEAVGAFRAAGGNDLVLLHCTSIYPTPPEDVHLRKIPQLAARFGCLVGLSDHTDGIVAALAAVALGACFIEKHFTLDKTLPGPDHKFSADPVELARLVTSIRELELCLGEASIGFTPREAVARQEFRLSCVAAGNLLTGHLLSEEDIVFRRPGAGLPPSSIGILVGRVLRRSVVAGSQLRLEDMFSDDDGEP